MSGLFLTVMAGSCATDNKIECRSEYPCIPEDEPHSTLSEYQFFKDPVKALEPEDFLLPYDLNTQLFSDYALKLRLVYVPDDSRARISDEGVLEFPVGSVLIKNFFYEHDLANPAGGRTILETRLLIHRKSGWTAATYVWNENQDEAFLKQTGDSKTISWIDREGRPRTVNYLIPTKNDCKVCHSMNNKLIPLGPKTGNLNKTYPYAGGAENQLVKWQQAGFLTASGEPEAAPRLPAWDDPTTGTLDQRVRAYLDVNCSSCHNPAGSARNTGLSFEYDEENAFRLGVCKIPVSAGSGSGGLKYDIVPGAPDRSILVYRMESNRPEVRMPEIGRTIVHEEAVTLIRDWIQSMNPKPCN